MSCPLKPSLTCAGTPRLASEGRCLGCTAGRAHGRPAASGDLPLSPPLAALRRQLRERLAEVETTPRRVPKVKDTSQGLVKSKSQDFFSASGSEASQGLQVKGTSQGLDFAGVTP